MKNTLFYLIIAGIIAWLLYRNYKKKHQTAGNADVLGEYTDNDSSGTNADEDRLHAVITTEDCPYCGAMNARITRWKDTAGNTVRMEVMCGNRSCPGSALGGGVISKSLIKTNKFVTAS